MLYGTDLILFSVIAQRPRYCERPDNLRMHKIPVTAFSATVYKTRSLKLGNQLPDFLRHRCTLCRFFKA